jgi:hypothetical protein
MSMRLIFSLTFFPALALMVTLPGMAAPRRHAAVQLAGTYSNLEYNEEGGDLLGIEIKIVPAPHERFQAAVLVSEGAPSSLFVVDVKVIRSHSGFPRSAAKFRRWRVDVRRGDH